jgi:hypothetical protein
VGFIKFMSMMARKTIVKIVLSLILVYLLVSCENIPQYPSVPEIHYKSLAFTRVYDTALASYQDYGILTFSFRDGDADLGVYQEVDTNQNYPDSVRHGIFISFFSKENGKYIEQIIVRNNDTLSFDSWLPYNSKMDRVGQDKTIKGTIKVSMSFVDTLPYDTMRFQFFIRDRAMHKSNIEVTDDFTNADLKFN